VRPDFDDLVDEDVRGAERERLERVHELLVAAGPPAELPPHLENPTLALTLARRPGRARRRVAAIAAIAAVLVVAFVLGYLAGNRGGGLAAETSLHLRGTRAAPNALASLRILPVDTSGNWPMRLSATGLPKLGHTSYYEVFLVRNGKIYAPCGSFVSTGTVDVTLNAPYRLKPNDTWVVTRQERGDRTAGPVVLRPTT
jgi:Anti-sigma-K factor rskA